jgi:hypothetical protein
MLKREQPLFVSGSSHMSYIDLATIMETHINDNLNLNFKYVLDLVIVNSLDQISLILLPNYIWEVEVFLWRGSPGSEDRNPPVFDTMTQLPKCAT